MENLQFPGSLVLIFGEWGNNETRVGWVRVEVVDEEDRCFEFEWLNWFEFASIIEIPKEVTFRSADSQWFRKLKHQSFQWFPFSRRIQGRHKGSFHGQKTSSEVPIFMKFQNQSISTASFLWLKYCLVLHQRAQNLSNEECSKLQPAEKQFKVLHFCLLLNEMNSNFRLQYIRK